MTNDIMMKGFMATYLASSQVQKMIHRYISSAEGKASIRNYLATPEGKETSKAILPLSLEGIDVPESRSQYGILSVKSCESGSTICPNCRVVLEETSSLTPYLIVAGIVAVVILVPAVLLISPGPGLGRRRST